MSAVGQTRTSADVCDTTPSPPQADMHRLVIVAEGPIGVYLLGTTTFEAAETMLSFEMQCDQEFGLFRSPFSSEWWPEVSVRLRRPGIEPDLVPTFLLR